MRDRGVIYTGLALFLGLISFPVWHNLSAGVTAKGPDVKLPGAEKKCVAPVEYMRTSHMNLLIAWRDQVVREGQPMSGKSLTPTCLEKCHGSKADFCDRCHNYAAVAPTCWNCHENVAQALVPAAPRLVSAPVGATPERASMSACATNRSAR